MPVARRVCGLALDEVKIKPVAEYKGGIITGAATNDTSTNATSQQVFLRMPLYGLGDTQVVAANPVSTQDGATLAKYFVAALSVTARSGWKVEFAVSDNFALNASAFAELPGQNPDASTKDRSRLKWQIPNPVDPQQTLFLFFDPTHNINSSSSLESTAAL